MAQGIFFPAKKKVWKNKKSLKTKIRILKAKVETVVKYSFEVWGLRKSG